MYTYYIWLLLHSHSHTTLHYTHTDTHIHTDIESHWHSFRLIFTLTLTLRLIFTPCNPHNKTYQTLTCILKLTPSFTNRWAIKVNNLEELANDLLWSLHQKWSFTKFLQGDLQKNQEASWNNSRGAPLGNTQMKLYKLPLEVFLRKHP